MQVVLTRVPHVLGPPSCTRARSLRSCCTCRGRRAACPQGPRTVRTAYAHQLGVYGTCRVPWRPAQVAGSALFWSNVDGAGLPEPLSVHEALPVRGEGVRKAAINVWVRGEAWDTPTTRLRILLKQLAPWCFPAAEVAQTFCPNCGQYIGSEASFRVKRLHSRRCPIHTM